MTKRTMWLLMRPHKLQIVKVTKFSVTDCPLKYEACINKGVKLCKKGEVLYHFEDHLVDSPVGTCNFQHKIHVKYHIILR